MKAISGAAVLLSFAALTGCSALSTAVFDTARAAIFGDKSADSRPLNPNFRYLRVATADGRLALIVLGYVDPSPKGPVEVWYSAEREALRLQNGRVVGAAGLPAEWHNVRMPSLPAWEVLARSDQPFRWIRSRDVLPGYHADIQDTLSLRRVAVPRRSEYKGADLPQLVWFEESEESTAPRSLTLLGRAFSPKKVLPLARYAVRIDGGVGTVVYAEQCLSADICFSWQRWPAASSANTPAK